MARGRTRVTKVLFKLEGTAGTDASPNGANFLRTLEESSFALNFDVIDNPERRGGLGEGEHTPGAARPSITPATTTRASGTASTPPETADLLQAAGFVEYVRAAIASVTAASGTGTTVTFDRTGATDWPATNNSFLGEPVILGGNPSTATVDFITGYAVSGNNVTLTLATTYATPLSSSTTIVKPAAVIYKSQTPSPNPTGSYYEYMDPGILQKFLGCSGGWSRAMQSGRPGVDRFPLFGFNGGRTDTSMLTGETDDPASGLPWKKGICHINKKVVCASSLNVDMNAAGFFPDCPAADEAIDVYEVTGRGFRLTIDPDLSLVATFDTIGALVAGTIMPVAAMLGPRTGGTAGTRCGMVMPAAKLRSIGDNNANGIRKQQLEFGSRDVGSTEATAEIVLSYF